MSLKQKLNEVLREFYHLTLELIPMRATQVEVETSFPTFDVSISL